MSWAEALLLISWLSTVAAAFLLGKLSSAPALKLVLDDESQNAELWMAPIGKVVHTSAECGYSKNFSNKRISIKQCQRCRNEATLRLTRKEK